MSFRDVEELLAQRGIDLSYETVRCWAIKFGPQIARNLKRRRPSPSARWHLDEMVVNIRRKRMFLWRAVDDEGQVLDMIVQHRRDTAAALELLKRLMWSQKMTPHEVVTDGLRSYVSALTELGLEGRHRPGRLRENNRAEGAVSPTATCLRFGGVRAGALASGDERALSGQTILGGSLGPARLSGGRNHNVDKDSTTTPPATDGYILSERFGLTTPWRVLKATFPESLDTHCAVQKFNFRDKGLLQRHDYFTVVGRGRAAHHMFDHATFDGFVFPTHLRVVARDEHDHAVLTGPSTFLLDIEWVVLS